MSKNRYEGLIVLNVKGKEDSAQKIIERIMEAAEERYPSLGMGEDCRYTADGMVGSALACDGWYVHAAFFRNDRGSATREQEPERMSSLSRRRGYRSGGPLG